MASTLKVTVQYHALDQCEALVGGRRAAYICFGSEMPINWLPKQTIGFALTVAEKIAVAKFVRKTMERLTKEREAIQAEAAGVGVAADELRVMPYEFEPVVAEVSTEEKVAAPTPPPRTAEKVPEKK